MQKLGHRFGEDGEFWICYEDILRHYQCFERVRLFGPEWNVSQIWTTMHVPWAMEYNETYFAFTTTQSGPIVVVVSQLDDRYFRGLEGQYYFQLSFRVHKAGHSGYIVRSEAAHRMRRSANVELDLDAGEYEVYVKIKAWRDDTVLPVQDTIRKWAKDKRDKVSRIGNAYDIAHSRGLIVETKEEKKVREAFERKRMQKKRDAVKKDLYKRYKDAYYQRQKEFGRGQSRRAKKKEKLKAKKAEIAKKSKEKKAARAAAKAATEKETTVEGTAVAETKKAQAAETTAVTTNGAVAEAAKADDAKQDAVKVDSDGGGEVEAGPAAESKEETKAGESTEASKSPEAAATQENATEEEASSEECESESDTESLASFTDYSDGELEIKLDEMHREDPAMFDSSEEEEDSDEENGIFSKDPWNAVAVIGLRVYHRPDNGNTETMALRVVRPNPYADSEGSSNEDGDGDGETRRKVNVLDVDDSAIDSTLEGELAEKKETIMGERQVPSA